MRSSSGYTSLPTFELPESGASREDVTDMSTLRVRQLYIGSKKHDGLSVNRQMREAVPVLLKQSQIELMLKDRKSKSQEA